MFYAPQKQCKTVDESFDNNGSTRTCTAAATYTRTSRVTRQQPMAVRERTPDGRRMSRSMADATAATTSAAAGGNGSGSGTRLRRGSTSYDEHRNSFSSIASLNAMNNTNNTYGHVNAGGAASTGSPSAAFRRRSSNVSDYSQDARDLLNPKPLAGSTESLRHHEPTSSWDSLPLAFALLPAVGGLLFQGGDSFVTDLMLLGLGGIFLHWSVTQPWYVLNTVFKPACISHHASFHILTSI